MPPVGRDRFDIDCGGAPPLRWDDIGCSIFAAGRAEAVGCDRAPGASAQSEASYEQAGRPVARALARFPLSLRFIPNGCDCRVGT